MMVPALTQWRSQIGERPTNAQALAMLSALGGPPLPAQDLDLAATSIRFAWAAAGYLKAGDRFAAPTNAAHWSKPYPLARPLYEYLTALAARSDRWVLSNGSESVMPVLDRDLAAGRPAAIKPALEVIWREMQRMRAAGEEPQPIRPGRPTTPIPGTPIEIPNDRPTVPKPPPGIFPERPRNNIGIVILAIAAVVLMSRRK